MPRSSEEYLAALREERRNPFADHASIDAEIARLEAVPERRTAESVQAKRAVKRRTP